MFLSIDEQRKSEQLGAILSLAFDIRWIVLHLKFPCFFCRLLYMYVHRSTHECVL